MALVSSSFLQATRTYSQYSESTTHSDQIHLLNKQDGKDQEHSAFAYVLVDPKNKELSLSNKSCNSLILMWFSSLISGEAQHQLANCVSDTFSSVVCILMP